MKLAAAVAAETPVFAARAIDLPARRLAAERDLAVGEPDILARGINLPAPGVRLKEVMSLMIASHAACSALAHVISLRRLSALSR